jgi:hypothetical protein
MRTCFPPCVGAGVGQDEETQLDTDMNLKVEMELEMTREDCLHAHALRYVYNST